MERISLPFEEIILVETEVPHYIYSQNFDKKTEKLYLPFNSQNDGPILLKYLAQIIHELNHVKYRIKSDFLSMPPALKWREEYESYRLSLCMEYLGYRAYNPTISVVKVKVPIGTIPFEISRENILRTSEVSSVELFSSQALLLVGDNINEFGESFCELNNMKN